MHLDLSESEERKTAERDGTEIRVLRGLDDVHGPGAGVECDPCLVEFLTEKCQ